MSNVLGEKAERMLCSYSQKKDEFAEEDHANDAADLDSVRLKLYESSLYFARGFEPAITASGISLKGKAAVFAQRVIRKLSRFIYGQFSDRIFDFQTRVLETIGDQYRVSVKQELAINEIRRTIDDDRQTIQNQIADDKEAILNQIANDRDAMLRQIADERQKLAASARELMRTKWLLRDHLEAGRDSSARVLRCGICGYEAVESTFETKESDCIFAGGHLKRYLCPNCGCIFGPLKVCDQTADEFNDDYTIHYTGFRENDCTFKERWAFELLKPSKKGVYLDYGCGSWSHTIQELRDEGYNVYGYDPYSADVNNPYIITSRDVLMKMRFDGIFSNDLLEHLADPIEDMRFMVGLLRTPLGKMSHSTSCYAYKYEFTRFHLFFYTGQSVSVLAEKAGLRIVDCVDQIDEKDFICYVYAPVQWNGDLMNLMRGKHTEEGLSTTDELPIYGPYLSLPPDLYCFEMDIQLPAGVTETVLDITAESGKKNLAQDKLLSGMNQIHLNLNKEERDIELVVRAPQNGGSVVLKSLQMVWKNLMEE